MPLFIVLASVFALVCTAGLALPLVILVIVALACRRPPEPQDPVAIATLPSRRGTPVVVRLP
jgi:hypothetical protein